MLPSLKVLAVRIAKGVSKRLNVKSLTWMETTMTQSMSFVRVAKYTL